MTPGSSWECAARTLNMSSPSLLVLNHNLVSFRVHVVREGDQCGPAGKLTHDEPQPLVEFHEVPSVVATSSQFVAHYRLKTLVSVTSGLALSFHEPRWHLDEVAMATVHRWLAAQGLVDSAARSVASVSGAPMNLRSASAWGAPH